MTTTNESSVPRYPYVHVEVETDAAELISLELWELGAQGVEERDDSTFVKPDQPLGAGKCLLVASFETETAAREALAVVASQNPAHLVFVEGDDWRDGWRAHFKPLRVGERFVICPSWESFAAAPTDVVITLDPGGAFGTGTHESTQLVLRMLEQLPVAGLSVLDVGCGSGILAVGALLLGADRVHAIDVDAAAVEATVENGEVNGVAERVTASTQPITEIAERYPLVLANIEAHVLVPMAAELCKRLAPGGTLILSGILENQTQAVVAAYTACGPYTCTPRMGQGEWVTLSVQHRTDG